MLQFIRDTHIYRQSLQKTKSSTVTELYYTAVESTISHSSFLAALEPSRGSSTHTCTSATSFGTVCRLSPERDDLSRTQPGKDAPEPQLIVLTVCTLESRVGNPANPTYQDQCINGFNIGDTPCRSSGIKAEGASVKLTRPLVYSSRG